jgi:hypothetical protein
MAGTPARSALTGGAGAMIKAMSSDLVDDFLIIEDLDVIDETQIRKVIAEVEALASAEKTGLRVSVLTSEQWQTVVQRMLPKSVRRGAELYIHMPGNRSTS